MLQIKQQLADIKDDYSRLQSTSFATQLDVTLQDLVWASDMVTSRSFAFPKQLGAISPCLATLILLCRVCINPSIAYRSHQNNAFRACWQTEITCALVGCLCICMIEHEVPRPFGLS